MPGGCGIASVSPKGLQMIREHEKFVPHVYICPTGHPTIGYGHVIRPTDQFTHPLTPTAGEAMLRTDVDRFTLGVLKQAKRVPTQPQLDAMVSFAFNVGLEAFGDSTLLKKFNAGDMTGAADEFKRWVYGTVDGEKQELAGLKKRRASERARFMEAG